MARSLSATNRTGRAGKPRLAALLAAAMLGAAALPTLADAADFKLPADDYGKVVLPLHQSLGDAARDVVDRQNVFEPVGLLREDDPMRRLSRSIGRLDLKVEENGQQFLSTCTATIVEGNLVLTNYHCIPGFSGKVLEASILLDYYGPDSKTTRIPVETTPVEKDPKLDYSLSRLAGPAPSDLEPMTFSKERSRPLERLIVIHHPAGQPKMMTQFRCYAADKQDDGPMLRHRCDTLPGSSGALIFNSDRQVVGIHHSGGLNENDPNSFNEGSNTVDIIKESAFLHPASDAGAPAAVATNPAQTAPGTTTAAAAEARQPAVSPQPTAAQQPTSARQPAAGGDPNPIIGGSDRAQPYNDLLSQ
ncbi:trypsin-like serine peptidase [Jiella sonneratiae]|uniref:Serine protease n=1 Tax=Jiella sonneratiae TaxID=2816856 RepID=A0ABS3J709_9HYPH|nr:serine protease [Jiella sonneratiae]MBO0905466.1 trypsin-like peptidase domain-containing protein [Jiella sonneratiae]